MSVKSLYSCNTDEYSNIWISINKDKFSLTVELQNETTYEEELKIEWFPHCDNQDDVYELISECLEQKRYTYLNDILTLHINIIIGKKVKTLDVNIELKNKIEHEIFYTQKQLNEKIEKAIIPLKTEIEELKSELGCLKKILDKEIRKNLYKEKLKLNLKEIEKLEIGIIDELLKNGINSKSKTLNKFLDLVEKGMVDPNLDFGFFVRTALHMVYNSIDVEFKIECKDIFIKLLKNGANPNLINDSYDSYIHMAYRKR